MKSINTTRPLLGSILIWIAAMLVSGTASAFAQPNLYELSGKKLQITYSTSSLSGLAQLHYRDSKKELLFKGDEIRIERSALGRLVTITLEQVPDLETVTATILIPNINLHRDAVSFKTLFIRTTQRTSIAGPELVKGPLQSYASTRLKGRASHVDFIHSNLNGQLTLSPTCGGGVRPGQVCSQPFADAWVQVLDADTNLVASAVTDSDGMFGLHMSPGRYTVRAGIPHELLPPIPLPRPVHTQPYPSALDEGANAADILVYPAYPFCPDTTVTVPVQGSTYVTIDCDTGIR